MKTKKILLWTLAILLTLIVIRFIYLAWLASGVSATLPPIKTYEYNGKVDLIMTDLKSYEIANNHLMIDIIDTLHDDQNIFGYEIICKYARKNDGDTLRYHLKCIEGNSSNTTIVKLIGAHNLNNNTGGYGLKVKGMDVLIDYFDTYLVDSLRKRYGLILKADNKN